MIRALLAGTLLYGLVSSSALAGSWDDGWIAYDSRDYAKALRLWEPLAELGFPTVQVNIASMYLGQDPSTAAAWYLRAADQGYAAAQFNLGVMYEQGLGVPIDEGEASKWYRRAAEQGYYDAQYNLAHLYASGRGVERDLVMAYVWFGLAAEGDDDAEANRQVIERLLTRDQIDHADQLLLELEATIGAGYSLQ